MKVLVFYHFYNQRGLLHNYASRLKSRGIDVDVICIDNFENERYCCLWWPITLRKASVLYSLLKYERLRNKFRSIINRIVFPLLFKKYDVVDFNAYYGDYNYLLSKCKECGTKTVVSLWGSDLMRANTDQLKKLQYGLEYCDLIKLSENLLLKLVEKYGERYNNKCRISYFGNADIEVIDTFSPEKLVIEKELLFGETGNKTIIACGYNAIQAQNHNDIIDEISLLEPRILENSVFVFPMTYGPSRKYIEEIRQRLESTRIEYRILDSFLSEVELATLRQSVDIVLNIQSTDAMSASLQDHLYCGNVCIIGEWLNYVPYDRNGVFYLKCSKESLHIVLKEVFDNLPDYRAKCEGNKNKIKSLFSWDVVIDNFLNIYKEVEEVVQLQC